MKTEPTHIFANAFSMIELLTVISIITLLAAFTIPAYLNHIQTTKLNSLWQLAEPAKLYVQSQYLKHNTDVTTIDVNANSTEFTTAPDPDLVRCITIQNGVVSVVANPAGFSGNAYWISWTPTAADGALTWACNYDATAAEFIADSVPDCTSGTAAFSDDATCNG